MIKKIWRIEAVRYIIIGGMTTGVNFLTHFICRELLSTSMNVAILVAWLTSVLFAFFTNKYFVFYSGNSEDANMFKEFSLFIGARVSSLGIEFVIMYLCVSQLHLYESISKVFTQFFILVANYFFSKWIFKS